MSTATATVPDAAAPKKKGKKKLIVIGAVLALVLAAGGGGATWYLGKKKADAAALAEADGEGSETEAGDDKHAKPAPKRDPKVVPTFVPLDPFTVNLADRDAERYAQVGITLEIDDAKTGDQIKAFMPAIRNNILMAIADRTAAELMDRDGKQRLADRVRVETLRALGHEVPPDEPATAPSDGADKPKKKKKKVAAEPESSAVKAVHFSNFIIQ